MNTHKSRLALIALAGLLPLACLSADENTAPSPAPAPKAPKTIHRELKIVRGEPKQLEKATFLGISTVECSEALSSQLGLAPGQGVLVVSIAPDGPSASVLKKHDLLLKFEDQILFNPAQLRSLVRLKKEGDEVALTLLRGGKTEVLKVKLVLREMPVLAADGGDMQMRVLQMPSHETNETLHMLKDGIGTLSINNGGGPGALRRIDINSAESKTVLVDGKMTITVSSKGGKQHLVARDEDGKVYFNGPINTPEERKALPADIAKKLEDMESKANFKWEINGEIPGTPSAQVEKQHILVPHATSRVAAPGHANLL